MCEKNDCTINYRCTMDKKKYTCKYFRMRYDGDCYFSCKIIDNELTECSNLKAQTESLQEEIVAFFESYHENYDQTIEQLSALLLNKAITENLLKDIKQKEDKNGTNSQA